METIKPETNCSEFPNNSDTISRQAAIDAIESAFDRETILNRFVRKIAISAVRLLPSAQPELKKGKWIYNSPVTMKCNQCGLVIKDWDWHRLKYCPNCISDMRGEQE